MVQKGTNHITIEGYLRWNIYEKELELQHKMEGITNESSWVTDPLVNIINDFIEYDGIPHTIDYTEEGLGTESLMVPHCAIRVYFTDIECSIEEAQTEFLNLMYVGNYFSKGYNVGYSEYTITGFHVDTLTIGGHDLLKELKSHDGQYINMIIEF